MTVPRPWSALKSFVRLTYAKLAGYEMLTTSEEFSARYRTCLQCKFWDDGQCRVCGCFLSAKASLAPEACPKGFWGSIWTRKRLK